MKEQIEKLLADWQTVAEAEYDQQFAQSIGKEHHAACRAASCNTHWKDGPKYAKLDIGGSGAFMLDKATGEIFCIKGYGVIDRRKRVGVLGEVTGQDLVRLRFWRLR